MFVILCHLRCQGDPKRCDLDFQRGDSLRSTDQRERSSLCRSSYRSTVRPKALPELFVPIAFGTRDELLKQFPDSFVEGFSKAISWRIVCRGGYALYSEFSAKLLERVADELRPIIMHNPPGDTKTVDHVVFDKLDDI